MNDEELDALVEQLDNLFAMLEEEGYYTKANTADFARKAITTIRTQLAEADAMIEAQAKDHAENNIRLAEMAHRADRAEAALAAQIEADARIVVSYGEGSSRPVCKRDCNALATAIRNQTHDRTALDRMLAEAREKVPREAIIEGMRIAIFTPIEQVPAAIDDAILALIETTR